jgi:hypothetical protein
MAAIFKRAAYEVGRALRETGQAIDRIGACRLPAACGARRTRAGRQRHRLGACRRRASQVSSAPRSPRRARRPPTPRDAGLRAIEKPIFKEPFSRHRAVMNLYEK